MEKHKFASISLTVQDTAISSKFLTHRVLKTYSRQFSKKFSSPQKWRPFGIFAFLPKMEKHKFASISLTVQDRVISLKISTQRVSNQCTVGNFQKTFLSRKMAAILNFRILAKFSTHRVSRQCTLGNFQKIFLSPKMAAILNFRIFGKNAKTQTV